MEPAELDFALEELETRLERLRALYAQYFLGIEKIEPSVARKDVDRRIFQLRRIQLRNTAKRFKLQTLIQRYNTFQQYWQRTCREIENGTYRRHILKAEQRFGVDDVLTIAQQRRLGLLDRQRNRDGDDEAAARAERAAQAASDAEADLARALEDDSFDPIAEAKRAMDEVLGRTSPPDPLAIPHAAPAPSAAQRQPSTDLGTLDLDLDFGSSSPRAEAAPAPRPAAPPARPVPAPRPPTPPDRPPPPQRQAAASGAAAKAPPAPPPRPAPPVRPATAAPARPATATAAPTAARPAPPPQQSAPLAKAAPKPPPPKVGPDQRIQQVYAKLSAAKQQTQEKSVSIDALERSLRKVEAQLLQKHGAHRNIDFDVVIKNGKAVVKPIVR